MRRLLSTLQQRGLISLLGVIAVSALIWFVGPLIAIAGVTPLDSIAIRVTVIVILFVAWAAVQLFKHLRARRRNGQMAQGLAESSETDQSSAEELQALQKRFAEALATLKRTRSKSGRRHYLYRLPWYIIIGPPGAGKTTALLNSGLTFPLADRFGQSSLKGVGGTRDCDWWFTDEAVLLDTAGRYTTQDSQAEVDRSAWLGFLDLLKKHRRRRPINGILVAISLADLLGLNETERAQHAKAIRQRVHELHEQLGIRFPVYVLVTKTDLLAGFTDFFDDLGQEQRAQVWGVTFPAEASTQQNLDDLAAEYDRLTERLNDRLLERLHQERDPDRRTAILAFPQQFAGLKGVLQTFLQQALGPSRFEEPPMLRGVYLTSGTQEGTPIDRFLGSFRRRMGLDLGAGGSPGRQGRSYFLERLLKEVIFPESDLAGTNLRLEKRRTALQAVAYTAMAAIVVLALVGWTLSYYGNRAYLDRVSERVTQAERAVNGLTPEKRGVAAPVPALDALKAIPGSADPPSWRLGLGLYQGDKVLAVSKRAYRRALRKALLPRIMLHLEAQLRNAGTRLDYLYEVLRIYLMLKEPDRFDAGTFKSWLSLDWQHNLPREVSATKRRHLERHLDALVETGVRPLPVGLDESLIARSRRTLSRVPAHERIYARLKQELMPADVAPFRVGEAAGRDAALVFVRGSGQSLSQGVPGLYTREGFLKLFLVKSRHLVRDFASETWVLGDAVTSGPRGDPEVLMEKVQRLYLIDYVEHWEDLLADIEIAPFSGLTEASELLSILSASDSPMKRLLGAVAHQTDLSLPARAPKDGSNQKDSGARQRFERLLGSDEKAGSAGRREPGSYVTSRFAELRRQVTSSRSGSAPIAHVLTLLDDLYRLADSMANAKGESVVQIASQRADDVLSRIRTDARRRPPPLNRWLRTVSEYSSDVVMGGVTGRLNSAWRAEVVPFCRQAIEGRYPMDRGSSSEVTLADFGDFFGPQGVLHRFFSTRLEPFVDTSSRPWRWAGRKGRQLGLSTSTLQMFQRASEIRRTFFAGQGKRPSLSFQLTPAYLDASSTRFQLSLGGQTITYGHGPTRPHTLEWPDPQGHQQVQIRFSPPTQAGRSGLTKQGPWAWFRLLDESRMQPTESPNRFLVIFRLGDREARYELHASSVFNPFRMKALEAFHCPRRL